MATPRQILLEILGGASASAKHDLICKCAMCMKSSLPAALVRDHERGLKATMVDRRNPETLERPLMKANAALSMIKSGSQVPILAEYRLARAVNHQMMIDKLRFDDSSKELELSFFQSLPMDILKRVQDVLPFAKEALEERQLQSRLLLDDDGASMLSDDGDTESTLSSDAVSLDDAASAGSPTGSSITTHFKQKIGSTIADDSALETDHHKRPAP